MMDKLASEISGTTSVRPQNDLETSVALMAKIGSCWSPSISADGTRIAFVSDLNGIPQVWIVSTKGGWPELITALDDPIDKVAWSPDGAWLAFELAPGSGSQQVYLVRPDGSQLRRLTDGGEEINFLDGWTQDGRNLAISSNRRNPEAVDAYLLHIKDGQMRLVAETHQGDGFLADISRDGKQALLYRSINRGDNDLYLINLESSQEILLTSHEGPASFENGRFSPDGQIIYLTSNQDRELVAFGRIVLGEDGQPRPIEVLAEREDAELERFEITKNGQTAALVWNVAGRNEIDFFDLMNLEITSGPELPAEINHGGLTFSNDGNLLALALSGAASPQDIFVYNRGADRWWQVTHSPHAGIDLTTMGRPELARFPSHDGLQLSGWLYRPENFIAPGPIALNLHGGPERQARPAFKYTYQALLAQGIAVFDPNVRGSAGFGKTFVNLDNGPLRLNAIRDIKACAAYVVEAGIADPDRLGIMGDSFGGYMAMAGLAEYPECFAAGVNLYGIVNFETFFENTEPWQAAASKVKIGDPETDGELLRRLSPIHKPDRILAPTLVLHGANDTVVPVIEAEQIINNLKKRDIKVKYILFPDEGHGFHKETNRIRATVEIVCWFVEHLKVDAEAND